MKSPVRLASRLILILLILMTLSACLDDSSDNSSSNGTETETDGTPDETDTTGYAVDDTGQIACYDDSTELVTCPDEGGPFYGQDNQFVGNAANFTNNGDGTVTDNITGLMWQQSPDTDGDGDIDAGDKLTYDAAVAGADALNHAGYSDWRLPNIKELHSIVDYTRSPGTTSSAAIDPLFNTTAITNEAGQTDYPCYWSGTTHANWNKTSGGSAGAYVAFGRAMGYMDGAWRDVHGAGAQRSDPKAGDPADYPTGNGPQGDAIRIYNYVRLVRDTDN